MSMLDPHELRSAFGSFMTGVTIVTTCDRQGLPFGFTANSFTSVSLDPPLLLVCPGKHLSSYETFANCPHFAVSILAEGQEAISNVFASAKNDRFSQVQHHPDKQGVPLINGAIAHFSCSTHQSTVAGDHCILIGRVDEFEHNEGRGLGYAGGQYFSLGLERDAFGPATAEGIFGAIIEHDDHVYLEHTGGGFRPPQVSCPDPGRQRQELREELSRRGIETTLGSAYSVFDDRQKRSAYILATATRFSSSENIQAVPIEDLTSVAFTSQPIADMMARFALEYRTRDFSLYIGDAHRGDVHKPTIRN